MSEVEQHWWWGILLPEVLKSPALQPDWYMADFRLKRVNGLRCGNGFSPAVVQPAGHPVALGWWQSCLSCRQSCLSCIAQLQVAIGKPRMAKNCHPAPIQHPRSKEVLMHSQSAEVAKPLRVLPLRRKQEWLLLAETGRWVDKVGRSSKKLQQAKAGRRGCRQWITAARWRQDACGSTRKVQKDSRAKDADTICRTTCPSTPQASAHHHSLLLTCGCASYQSC